MDCPCCWFVELILERVVSSCQHLAHLTPMLPHRLCTNKGPQSITTVSNGDNRAPRLFKDSEASKILRHLLSGTFPYVFHIFFSHYLLLNFDLSGYHLRVLLVHNLDHCSVNYDLTVRRRLLFPSRRASYILANAHGFRFVFTRLLIVIGPTTMCPRRGTYLNHEICI